MRESLQQKSANLRNGPKAEITEAAEFQGRARMSATELAAVTTGSADEEGVTLEQDEADRDAFFAVRVMATPPPSAAADTSPGSGGGADPLCPSPSPGKVSARSDDGGGNSPATKKPQKPPKSEPPPSPDRSRRGASNSGETP